MQDIPILVWPCGSSAEAGHPAPDASRAAGLEPGALGDRASDEAHLPSRDEQEGHRVAGSVRTGVTTGFPQAPERHYYDHTSGTAAIICLLGSSASPLCALRCAGRSVLFEA
ncbi:hypothetical protein MEX01_02410 [Methylorubrum extorquens]|nr:hypothetical protein MEX01_02410 [Methylorubrum extorquens]